MRDKLPVRMMQADAFWKNYSAAQEWQKRHSVVWWKSRCIALEYENQILKDKVRSLAYRDNRQPTCKEKSDDRYDITDERNIGEEKNSSDADNESVEFEINEDLMSFLEQSIRHKVELKKMRESKLAAKEKEKEEEMATIQTGAAWAQARNRNAKLLYGDASPRILAMETALQATTNRHKDKAKPQYWPNIPLRL
ncbi:hypothetical protein KM043_002627 [Ampulex compressa]|nr:hypothetical protein KM043_002627 [Ampulex compressa]